MILSYNNRPGLCKANSISFGRKNAVKIVFLDENTVTLEGDIDLSGLRALGEYRRFSILPDDDPVPPSGGADVMIVNKVKVTRRAMRELSGLRLICLAATGYDNVDIEAAREMGIRVANVAGYARHSVAQHVFAMILNFATRVHDYHRDVQRGEWQKSKTFVLLKYPAFELAGKTIGIVGFGAIGSQVARIAEAFGMHVLIHDPADIPDSRYENVDLEVLLANADVVSLNCPLTEGTKNLINESSLKMMKSNAFLVNTARGGIVDEPALARALAAGEIAGAGVDTISAEPPGEHSPLLAGVPNLIVTPHTAWSTRDARQRLVDAIVENIRKFSRGDFEGFVV
jgi:glycerate dehydrogenase